MQPKFSFTAIGRWKLQLCASPQELAVLRGTNKFNHKIVLHRKWKEPEWDWGRGKYVDVSKEEPTLLGNFSVNGEPLATFWTFPAQSPKEVEDWESEVTKRITTLTSELAMLIPP